MSGPDPELEAVETDLLVQAVYRRYGFDFRDYAPASLRRRIRNAVEAEKLPSVSALQERVLRDPACLERLLLALSVNVTSLFRDPAFYRVFREKAVPLLRTYPFLRLWCAGCSTGEEVYSLAILLDEEGLYERSRIYATDMNQAVLDRARAGIFPLSQMQEYTRNYLQAGGKREFSEYYTASHDHAILRPSLRQKMVFAQHNLVTDSSFNEFQAVLCRNVLIYFNRTLQNRVHGLIFESLCWFGMVGLGSKETVRFTCHEKDYEALDPEERLYRRVR